MKAANVTPIKIKCQQNVLFLMYNFMTTPGVTCTKVRNELVSRKIYNVRVALCIQQRLRAACHWRIQRGWQGVRTCLKNHKNRVSLKYWSGSPEKSQSYQVSIYSWAIIGPPAKRHLNGVSLAGGWWPIFSDVGSYIPSFLKKISNFDPL